MTIAACVLCHYQDLRPRWVGGLMATFCDTCGCLYFSDPEPLPTPRAVPVSARPHARVPVQREQPAVVKGT